MMPKPPCGGCPDRVISCHSTCERYKAYQEEIKAEKMARDAFRKQHDAWTPPRKKKRTKHD